MKPHLPLALIISALSGMFLLPAAKALDYHCSKPLLEATFTVTNGHYSGKVHCGNLFLQTDIPTAPLIRWKGAKSGKLYTLLMLDLDGNANGSWPDLVNPGQNAPLRHWIVGNIPGDLLRNTGYLESVSDSRTKAIRILQPYRAPHIPVVSDRYGLYLFEQTRKLDFAELPGPITNFGYSDWLNTYKLGSPKASNYFVAIYTSESPFSGKAFHGNDVSESWHKDYNQGHLPPSP